MFFFFILNFSQLIYINQKKVINLNSDRQFFLSFTPCLVATIPHPPPLFLGGGGSLSVHFLFFLLSFKQTTSINQPINQAIKYQQ
eukprot:m.17107 g.17107  ORF g.17107 m.17107 type:complete len:85 (-) comp4728_c0_seq1:2073-2327(-)